MFRRILYLGYYFKELDLNKLWIFLTHAEQETGRKKISLLFDAIVSSFRYNASILDYFYFRFFKLDEEQRATWAGTGFMYEYQLKMNPNPYRQILIDKIRFFEVYYQFTKRRYATLSEFTKADYDKFAHNLETKIVLKGSRGQVGAEVEVVKVADFQGKHDIVRYMRKKGYDLLEEYIVQHPALMRLSPSGLNTLRLITQMDKDQNIHLIGARLRISIDSHVDNLAAGNVAAEVDLTSGEVASAAVYSDITRQEVTNHPITGERIVGFQIPYWEEAKEMVFDAAKVVPQNKSIGWDVAISVDGPLLIEGNHNWCKLLWQLPVRKGLKHQLEKYL